MKNALKAALLSALVFPGLGQLWLKRYRRGAVFIGVFCAGLAAVVVKSVQTSMAVLEKLEVADVTIDMNTITQAAENAISASDSLWINGLLLVLLLIWIGSIVDAWRIGKKMDDHPADRPR